LQEDTILREASAELTTFPLSSAPVLCDITPSNLSLAAKAQTVPQRTLNSQASIAESDSIHTINKKKTPSGWTPHSVTLAN